MKQIDLPASRCPGCGRRLDAASDLTGDARPAPGDVTICLHCGHLMAFADNLTLRELTAAEAHDVAGDPRVQAARGEVMKSLTSSLTSFS